jgi:acyl dehydratase
VHGVLDPGGAGMIRYDDVEVGTELPTRDVTIQRVDLVRYAGASGDFNPIHWNQRFATEVGLPDVIAHGMFTMAQAGRLLTDWVGDPAAVDEFGVRFTKPVVVPDDGAGATVTIGGRVREKLGDGRARVDLTVTFNGEKVLGAARAVVRLG